MQNEPFSKIIDYAFQLLSEASLSIGFVHGSGLGAVLLALIAIIFIRSRPFSRTRLADLVSAWQGKKPQTPSE